jgi:hypothetical protein
MELRQEQNGAGSTQAKAIWMVLIAALSVAGSLAFACAAPLAAIAALAALTMRRMEGVALVVVAWLANQIVGFGFLHYPLEASTFGWGAAIGAGAVAGFLVAHPVTNARLPSLVALILALLVSFAVYEVALYGYGLAVGDSGESFTAEIVGRIFLINAVAFAGLLLLHRAAVALALLRPAPEATPAAV